MKQRLIATGIFLAYCAILIKVMVFKDLPVISIGGMMFSVGGSQEGPANLVPFKTIFLYLFGKAGMIIAGLNLIGNIVLLVPIGFLAPFMFPNLSWKKALILAVAAGSSIEGMQEILQVGIFDVDDIMLNALGVLFGYRAFRIFATRSGSVKSKTIITLAVIVTVIILVIAAAAVFYDVHIGQKPRVREHPEVVAAKDKIDSIDNREVNMVQGIDPCRGTGGTGQILSVRNNSITIKLHNGNTAIINFTIQTKVRNSLGAASKNDLRIGDRVTVVVEGGRDSEQIATAVFICK